MHSNYDNKRKDKSIYLAPYRINEILDDVCTFVTLFVIKQ